MKIIIFIVIFLNSFLLLPEVNSWECGKFNGAKIIAEDGTYLGVLGPRWITNSIFNDSSKFSSSWSSESVYNSDSKYGNSYSQLSVFNDSASKPPLIISKKGEVIGKLSVGPIWDNSRFNPYDIKYTCDWD